MGFLSILSFAHMLVKERVHPGDIAIDATLGNGNDTLFLCRLVNGSGSTRIAAPLSGTFAGSSSSAAAIPSPFAHRSPSTRRGHVFGFDVQPAALTKTRAKLLEEGGVPDDCFNLFEASHADMTSYVPSYAVGSVAAVMFNLGYLPGGDQSLVTTPETTLSALESSLTLLRPGGIVTVVVYPGHPGGEQEASAVHKWASQLPQDRCQTLSYRFLNPRNAPPYLIAVHKRT